MYELPQYELIILHYYIVNEKNELNLNLFMKLADCTKFTE
jgi:hypothetical protein